MLDTFILYICLCEKHIGAVLQRSTMYFACNGARCQLYREYLGIDFMRLTLITSCDKVPRFVKTQSQMPWWWKFHVQLRVFPSLSLLKFHWNLVNAKVTMIKVFYEVLARSNVTKQAIIRAKTFDKTIIFYRLQGIHENGKLKKKREKR